MLVAPLLVLAGLQAPAAPVATPPASQILWQRSLEDALALAADEHRPILVAVNMDGESASERIVRENYRDPEFVARTRPFVCLVASAFRHTPRDHDDSGRRIPCPRLGEITCGEHVALEPVLFDRWLGGERIAPRHALILQDGTKAFDLTLLFDLREIAHSLEQGAASAPPPRAMPMEFVPAAANGDGLERAALLRALAPRREHRERLLLESLALECPPANCGPFHEVLASAGNAGSSELLRILFAKAPRAPDPAAFAAKTAELAQSIGAAPASALALKDELEGAGPFPGAAGLGRESVLLPSLARMADDAPSRTLLISYAALGSESSDALASERAQAARALELRLGSVAARSVAAAIEEGGGAFDPERFLSAMRSLPPVVAPAPKPPAARTEQQLVAELEELEPALARSPDDAALQERSGRASFELAQLRASAGGGGVEFLLDDARAALERASRAHPDDVALYLERAHVAYMLARFDEEESLAESAWSALERAGSSAPDEQRIEALRWLGDAAARLLPARAQGDPALEAGGMVRGARALSAVVQMPRADETDWISLASFFGALGRRREEIAFAQAAVERLPESDALQLELERALELAGRPDLAPAKLAWLASEHPASARAAWYLGHALVVDAAWLRRGEQPDAAIDAYERAQVAFARSRELDPSFDDSVRHYLALCALGRGFAHLLADRRDPAASALVEAIALRPSIASVRDALDREAIDLLDGALEWRASGASPVDPLALSARLEAADPESTFWPRSISDSELREALRAIGRGEPEVGERMLRVAIDAGRRGVAKGDDEEARRALAQALTIVAERQLERGEDAAETRALLAEAAQALRREPPSESAGPEDWRTLARSLRESLGEARPIARPGR